MARQNNNTRRWDCTKITSWMAVLSFILTAVLPLPALAGDAVFYYHNDTTGSPIAVTNSAGTKVWGADYEPFGELAGVVETVPNNQQFLAKTVDPETSLHLLGARYYDGKLGRFLSVDPVLLKGQPSSAIQYPQRLNLYGYAGNNPYRHTDSSGRYLETAWDLVSLGLSLQSFYADPTVLNGLAVAYDTFALAVPLLPAGAGIVLKGAGGLEKAADAGRAVKGTDQTADAARETVTVQRWMSRDELKSTEATNLLRGGREGTHHVTDAANADPLRARQRLALAKTPEVRVTMEVPKDVLSAPSRVLPKNDMSGGGRQRTATGNVPVRIIKVN